MSTKFDLAYISQVTVDGQPVRKLVFAPQGVAKDDPAYCHASLLAGPWKKQTKICKGTLDGATIAAPFVIPLRLRAGIDGGQFLALDGVRIEVVDPVISPVIDDTTKQQRVGADKRPMFNLRGGVINVTSYTLSSGGDDDAAFSRAGAAAEPTATDDEAFA